MTDVTNIAISGILLVPLIVGLAQLFKSMPGIPKWVTPWICIALGVVLLVLAEAASPSHTAEEWLAAFVTGLAVGLAAVGSYETFRSSRRRGR